MKERSASSPIHPPTANESSLPATAEILVKNGTPVEWDGEKMSLKVKGIAERLVAGGGVGSEEEQVDGICNV